MSVNYSTGYFQVGLPYPLKTGSRFEDRHEVLFEVQEIITANYIENAQVYWNIGYAKQVEVFGDGSST